MAVFCYVYYNNYVSPATTSVSAVMSAALKLPPLQQVGGRLAACGRRCPQPATWRLPPRAAGGTSKADGEDSSAATCVPQQAQPCCRSKVCAAQRQAPLLRGSAPTAILMTQCVTPPQCLAAGAAGTPVQCAGGPRNAAGTAGQRDSAAHGPRADGRGMIVGPMSASRHLSLACLHPCALYLLAVPLSLPPPCADTLLYPFEPILDGRRFSMVCGVTVTPCGAASQLLCSSHTTCGPDAAVLGCTDVLSSDRDPTHFSQHWRAALSQQHWILQSSSATAAAARACAAAGTAAEGSPV